MEWTLEEAQVEHLLHAIDEVVDCVVGDDPAQRREVFSLLQIVAQYASIDPTRRLHDQLMGNNGRRPGATQDAG